MGLKPRRAPVTEQAILAQLDDYAARFEFPVLDNENICLAATRLHCFRTNAHWALLIEQFGFSHGLEGHERIDTGVYAYGNCIAQPGLNSIYATNDAGQYVPQIGPAPTEDGPDKLFAIEIEDGEEYESDLVHPDASSLVVRGTTVGVSHDRARYKSLGITLKNSEHIFVFELLRALVVEHKDLFLFSDEQLRKILPPGIQKVIQLEEWHHVGQERWEKPSESETFQMLAKVLATGDPTGYRPSLPPNTHWSHWSRR